MRETRRALDSHAYWSRRWSVVGVDDPVPSDFALRSYPFNCLTEVLASDPSRVLELGCGTGRVLRYLARLGHHVSGVDFVEAAVERLAVAEPNLDVRCADARELPYADETFDVVLAFGLFHNFPAQVVETALCETLRVLRPGGLVLFSFRADNLQNRLIDRLADYRRPVGTDGSSFHKLNCTARELRAMCTKAGFEIQSQRREENMPLLYRSSWLRHYSHRDITERRSRVDGYRLSLLGRAMTRALRLVAPKSFHSLHVTIASRPRDARRWSIKS